MDAIEKLESQHREVERFFREYRLLGHDAAHSREAIFEMLSDAVDTYAELEGRILYPASKARSTARILPRFVDEQVQLQRHLVELKQLQLGGEPFEQKLSELEREITMHAREESEQLFPRVREQLGRLRLVELGEQMERATRPDEPEGVLPS